MEDLETPYEPMVVHFAEAGYSEFVMADVPVVVRDIAPGISLLLDVTSRKPIGVRWLSALPSKDTP